MSKQPVSSINTPEYDVLIELLKEIRKEKGVSQEALSDRLQLSRHFIWKIEHKDRRFDVVEFLQVFTALGVDPVQVFARFATKVKELHN